MLVLKEIFVGGGCLKQQKTVIGIDVGGTKILIGLVTENGDILVSKKYPMLRDTQENALQTVFTAIEDFMSNICSPQYPQPTAIGMGTVGHIDPENGIWLQSYNIPISQPVFVKKQLEERYHLPVQLDNDVHCSTLGEKYFGAGKNAKCMIYVNIGTGISAGIVHHDMLIRGASNYAGEIGFMKMNCENDDEKLEPIASGGGLIAQAKKLLPQYPASLLQESEKNNTLHSASIFQAAIQGDELAQKLSQKAITFLGSALCNLMAIFNPDVIVLGGGVIKEAWLYQQIEAYIRRNCVGETLKALKSIQVSSLNAEHIGLIGAASLVLKKENID